MWPHRNKWWKWRFVTFWNQREAKSSTLVPMTTHVLLPNLLVKSWWSCYKRSSRSWGMYLWYWCWHNNAVNKVPGVRSACSWYDSSLRKEQLNANAVGFGGKITGELLMCDIIKSLSIQTIRRKQKLIAKIEHVETHNAYQVDANFFTEFLENGTWWIPH